MALAELLRRCGIRPIHGICGMLTTKDYSTACSILKSVFDTVICVDDFLEKAVPADSLAKCFAPMPSIRTADSFQNAYAEALAQAKTDHGMVVICGSLYLASEALQKIEPSSEPETRL